MIRRRETTLYQAATKISARFRWCLTGTPIQNRLEDVGSLLGFLRVSQLENRAVFRNCVVAPFEEDINTASENYAAVLDAVCLKRPQDLLKLPQVTERHHYIDLSDDERKQYDRSLAAMASLIREKVSRNPERGTQFSIFQVQLQLRLLCNHGTFQRGFQRDSHRDRRAEREDFLHALGTSVELTCSVCGIPVPVFDTVGTAPEAFGRLCRHKLCQECMEDMGVDSCAWRTSGSCPLCVTKGKKSRTAGNIAEAHTAPERREGELGYFNPLGFSSKVSALLSDLASTPFGTKRYVSSISSQ